MLITPYEKKCIFYILETIYMYIFPLNIKAAKWPIDMAFPDDMV